VLLVLIVKVIGLLVAVAVVELQLVDSAVDLGDPMLVLVMVKEETLHLLPRAHFKILDLVVVALVDMKHYFLEEMVVPE
jgi:hypothetical protein